MPTQEQIAGAIEAERMISAATDERRRKDQERRARKALSRLEGLIADVVAGTLTRDGLMDIVAADDTLAQAMARLAIVGGAKRKTTPGPLFEGSERP